jgi:hypothetical protein
MKSSDPMYARPGPVGIGGSGANQMSGRADTSAGVGAGLVVGGGELASGPDVAEDDACVLASGAGVGTGVPQALAISTATSASASRARFMDIPD